MRIVVVPGLDGTGQLHGPFAAALAGMPHQILSYPPDMADYATLARHVAQDLPGEPFVLVAESFAGPLALRLSRLAPPHLRGIVFVASFARRPRAFPSIFASLTGYLPLQSRLMCRAMQPLVMGRWGTPAFSRMLHTALRTLPSTTIPKRLAAVLAAEEKQALNQSTLPMLYLRAAQDRVVPRRASDVFAQAGVRIETLDGPHFLLQARPAAAAHLIRRFAEDRRVDA